MIDFTFFARRVKIKTIPFTLLSKIGHLDVPYLWWLSFNLGGLSFFSFRGVSKPQSIPSLYVMTRWNQQILSYSPLLQTLLTPSPFHFFIKISSFNHYYKTPFLNLPLQSLTFLDRNLTLIIPMRQYKPPYFISNVNISLSLCYKNHPSPYRLCVKDLTI